MAFRGCSDAFLRGWSTVGVALGGGENRGLLFDGPLAHEECDLVGDAKHPGQWRRVADVEGPVVAEVPVVELGVEWSAGFAAGGVVELFDQLNGLGSLVG